jgi:hypothetical protein
MRDRSEPPSSTSIASTATHRLALEALLLDVLTLVEGPRRAEEEERLRVRKRS